MIGQTEIKVTGRLDTEGNAAVTVTGIATYGKSKQRRVVHTLDVTDKKTLAAVGDALKKAIVDVRDQVIENTTNDAVEAYGVAVKRKEQL